MPAFRVVLLADTHLGYDDPVAPRVKRRRRGQDFFDNFQLVLDYAARVKPDLVVHGGDFFFRSRVARKTVDRAYESLVELARTGVPIMVVPGNHEWSRLPVSLWLAEPGIRVFDRPRTFRLVVSGAVVAVSGFPFVRDGVGRRFRAVVAESGWQRTPADLRLLCMHRAVEGAQVGPSNYTFRRGDDVVRMLDIPREFAAVLAGHIHRRQILRRPCAGGARPIIYPGSIERTSFAERDEAKGFMDVTFAPGDDGTWGMREATFHELPTRRMVDLEIDPAITPSGVRGYLTAKVASLDRDSVVRIRCTAGLDARVRAELTASFLRSVFPNSMNVQLSPEIYREHRTAAGHARG